MATYVGVTEKKHWNGDVTLTNSLDGSTERKTEDEMTQNKDKDEEDDDGKDPHTRKDRKGKR